ncbi:MAG: polysaccharide deacetylase family protein [Gemmatimonadota bacterium]
MRAILTYHSIDPSGSVISVDRDTFRRHAEWLAQGSSRAVTVDELLAAPEGDDCVAVVFDDAFENFGSVAWPILRDLELPATVFVVSGQVGATNAWAGVHEPRIPTLPLLDWDALGRLAEDGVHIGSHTRTHPPLDAVPAASLHDEIEGSAVDLESRLGRRPRGFAYPFGKVDDGSETVARSTYDWACTTELALVAGDSARHRLPRLDAFYYRRPGQLEAWGTAAFRGRLGIRRTARGARSWLAKRRAS